MVKLQATTSASSMDEVGEKNFDRLFVPLATAPYHWFLSGAKSWELRKMRRQFTPKHVRAGRKVELRKGYADKNSSLWGNIDRLVIADSLHEFFEKVDWESVIPESTSLDSAIAEVEEILGLETANDGPFIGFSIELENKLKIPLKNKYFRLVENGKKKSTIRAGNRKYNLGPASLVSNEKSIDILVHKIEIKFFGELSAQDAILDGFNSRDELLDALLGFYPKMHMFEPVTIIHFKKLGSENE